MDKIKLREEIREATTAFCGGVESHSENFIDELMGIIDRHTKVKGFSSKQAVSGNEANPKKIQSGEVAVCDLCGEMLTCVKCTKEFCSPPTEPIKL